MTKKQITEYIEKRINSIRVDTAQSIRREIDDILTEGTQRAINERIRYVMQENYHIDIAIGLKKK